MQSMRNLLITTATAVVAVGLLSAPAQAYGRPTTNAQLIAAYDCHTLNQKPTPGRLTRGYLADNLATAKIDLRHFSSHGAAYGGTWRKTHWCYA